MPLSRSVGWPALGEHALALEHFPDLVEGGLDVALGEADLAQSGDVGEQSA